MSGTGAKKRSTRVPTSGSVSSGSSYKFKKLFGGAKLLSSGTTLKGDGSGQVVEQSNSMDTDREASESEGISDFKMNTPQAKHFNNGVIIGFPLGSINYDMEEEEEISLSLYKSFSLDKAWIDSKIIKIQMEVAVKKSFTLNINLSAVKEKSAMAKTQVIKKLFLGINGFGGTTTPSKFKGIIRSIFTSEASIKKATSLAKDNNIIVNNVLKRQEVHSDQAVVIKKIPMDTPKEIIVTAVSEFGEIKSIKIQLIGLWQKAMVKFTELEQTSFLIGKDSVHVAMAVEDCDTWTSRDQFRVLLFTLSVGTTAHDLGNLLDGAGGKTCIINHSLETGNRFCCAVVGFESVEMLESAFHTKPVLGGVKLSWARLNLVWCERYGNFGHFALECDAKIASTSKSSKSFKRIVSDENHLQCAYFLTVVSLAPLSNNYFFGSGPGFGSFFSGASGVIGPSPLVALTSTSLEARLASLECSVELLVDKVSGIVSKLENLVLVPLAPTFFSRNLVVPVVANVEVDSDMALDDPKPVLFSSSLVFSGTSDLGSSSSKILTSKVGCLESKLMALETSVCSVLKKYSSVHVFVSGLDLGYLGSGVAIIMNVALAKHVYRISEVSGHLLAIKLLFKNKLSVSILGLYASASVSMCFSQADEINTLIAGTVNESSFVILGGDFNENSSCKSASFKKCGALGLVNFLVNSVFLKALTWSNSQGVAKTIDYLFVSPNLVNAIVDCSVLDVSKFFDTDHQSILVLVSLGGLLDIHLCLLHKQANRDHWKYNFKNADATLWSKFKEATVANTAMFAGGFLDAKKHLDLDAIWDTIHRTMCFLANEVFKKIWFKDYNGVFTKCSSRFHKLELLISKLVKAFCSVDYRSLFNSIHSVLSKVRKSYYASKLLKIKRAENSQISVVLDLPDGKATGLSGISNELWKNYDKSVLNMLLVLINSCLLSELMSSAWKEAWVSMISKPHEWEGVFTNTCPIALIETACKILSKILSNRISLACSKFDILCGNNFSVLKGTTTQSPIFAIGLVVEDALKKNQELWLVL
ncbi:hypothetical protein G9A89_022675 [Geosiphon pyriformis]|nr:hypothetical protein G9A89_022675 [Geosiphon pyriformis]